MPQLELREVVLGNGNVVSLDFPFGCIFPTGQPHLFLLVVSPIHNHLSRRLAVHCVMHLVLNCCKEPLRCRCGRVVIQRRGVNIRDFLVELAFRDPDFPNLLELPLKELIRQMAALLEAFGIHGPALDGVVLDDLVGPFAELDGTLVLDLEAHGDDCLQTVVLRLVALAVGGSC